MRTKRRRLRDVEFLTCGPRPRLIRIRSETRVRNAVQPSFATLEEGGLFVQELVFRGALFCGRLRVGALREEFGRRARFILENLRPEINGAIFEARLEFETPQTRESPASMNGLPRLVTEPIELLPEILDGGGTHLMIGSLRSYNTTLRRPRRNRIAILPGSVLPDSAGDERCLPWEGFDAKVEVPPAEGRDRHAAPRAAPAPAPAAGRDRVKGVGRSQFGRIRELQSLPPEAAIRKVKAILDKYASRKAAGKEVPIGLVPAGVLEDLLRLLKEDPGELSAYIDALAASHAAWCWEEERAQGGRSRKERAREELIRERSGGNVHP
jgi:hypothetical protein